MISTSQRTGAFGETETHFTIFTSLEHKFRGEAWNLEISLGDSSAGLLCHSQLVIGRPACENNNDLSSLLTSIKNFKSHGVLY